jgi:hypothetical protein
MLQHAWDWVRKDPTRALFVLGVAILLGAPIHVATIQSVPNPQSTPQSLSMDLMAARLTIYMLIADAFALLAGFAMVTLTIVNRMSSWNGAKSKCEQRIAGLILTFVVVVDFAIWFLFRPPPAG